MPQNIFNIPFFSNFKVGLLRYKRAKALTDIKYVDPAEEKIAKLENLLNNGGKNLFLTICKQSENLDEKGETSNGGHSCADGT